MTAFRLSRAHRLAPSPTAKEALPEKAVVEIAWDGHRVMACRDGNDIRMWSADFREWTDPFGAICVALRKVAKQDFVLDGFLCALDEKGRPSFERLRKCVQEKSADGVVFAVWDALRIDGQDLRQLPLSERRTHLVAALEGAPESIVFSQPLAGETSEVLRSVKKMGMRGIVGRTASENYPPAESWACVPCEDAIDWERSLSAPPKVTNQDKVLYPRDGFTKTDVVRFYDAIAPAILPYMKDRPIVCQRWPDGIDDFTWYQHRMPPRAPDYLRAVWIEGNRRIVIENKDALLWMVNQAALTFHGWASRVKSLQQPDWVVLDLDPGEKTTWEKMIEVALAIRKLLEMLELPSVAKTSGQKGLHVLVPIGPGHTAALAHDFARRASILIARLFPNDIALDPTTEKREGRLYLDHLQSFVGKSLVLPYSLRAANGGPVSAPIEWSEVTPKLDPKAYNLRTMRARLDAKGDLTAPLLSGTVRLGPIVERMKGSGA
jgi:DNA ligase D-like protein (predicted polymerase)